MTQSPASVSTTGIQALRTEALDQLTLAWATDSQTGLPIYIDELPAERNGAKSDCTCPGCGDALVAVNNSTAQENRKRRPHFRHMPGRGAQDCSVLAARVAMFRELVASGTIHLPPRKRRAMSIGLDGKEYWGDALHRPRTHKIAACAYEDDASAILTLDDGRQLRVMLRATIDTFAEGCDGQASIAILMDSDVAAHMSPEEIRSRLTMESGLCWQKHWDDNSLDELATQEARKSMQEALAAPPDDANIDLEGMPTALKAETVLHLASKTILQRLGRLQVPGKHLRVERRSSLGRVFSKSVEIPARWLYLSDIAMEKQEGNIRPDLVCTASDETGAIIYERMCIEVTVTNIITEERIGRIRASGLATLEIDLGHVAGNINVRTLEEFLASHLTNKKWLFNPVFDLQYLELSNALDSQIREHNKANLDVAPTLERVRPGPDDVMKEYLSAALRYYKLYAQEDSGMIVAREELQEAGDYVALNYGQDGFSDRDFFDARDVLDTLLSLKIDRGLSRAVGSGFQVLNAAMSGKRRFNQYKPLYLAAVKEFNIKLSPTQRKKVDAWRKELLSQLEENWRPFARDTKFDGALKMIFPELKTVLARTTPGAMKALHEKIRAKLKMTEFDERYTLNPEWENRGPGYLTGDALKKWIQEHEATALSQEIIQPRVARKSTS